MRIILGLALAVLAVTALSAPALAAPSVAGPAAPTLLDHRDGVRVGVGLSFDRPFGVRYAGGYYRTTYQWVWVPGALSHVDAFGRPSYFPGHWEQRPVTTWVPYTAYYARPYYRPYGGFVGGSFRIR
jgi:hypothetical protein